jgi:hypothetical protein
VCACQDYRVWRIRPGSIIAEIGDRCPGKLRAGFAPGSMLLSHRSFCIKLEGFLCVVLYGL